MFNLLKLASLPLLLTVMLAMLLGCSGGGNPTVPPAGNNDDNVANQPYEGGKNMGEYTLSLDAEHLTAVIEPVNRQNDIIVTNFLRITILSLQWDPAIRLWNIDLSIMNPTRYTAFGPWIVFTETGEQRIINQDGFIWWVKEPGLPPERVPVIAFAKPNNQRAYYAGTSEQVHLQIHWPAGWDSFNPMHFFIDVAYPNPRQQPIIENLRIQPTPIPESFNLTAFVKDWQQSPVQPALNVWVDLSMVGGMPNEPLFDDGQHGDGMPGDDIWGCNFMAFPQPQPIPLTVWAKDWEGFIFQNDVMFGAGGPQPGCLPMEVLDEGPNGLPGLHEIIIRDGRSWEYLWMQLHPGSAPPPVDFTKEQIVFVNLGGRPSTGYAVHIDCVQEIMDPNSTGKTIVDYTEEIPGPDCNVLWVITNPYQIVKTRLTVPPDQFNAKQNVYPCQPPPECLPTELLDEGQNGFVNPFEYIIRNEREYLDVWNEIHPNEPAPPVFFEKEQVVVVMLGERPTTGYSVHIDCVREINEPTGAMMTEVTYTEEIPGRECPVEPILSFPYQMVKMQLTVANDTFIHNENIYPCIQPDCLPIRQLAEGNHSNIHGLAEKYLTNQEDWMQFWAAHGATDPAPDVDWNSEVVMAIVLGDRPTGGFWVRVDCVRFIVEDPSQAPYYQVEYTEMVPGPGCPAPDVITQPFLFFAVPRLGAERAQFIAREEIYECPPTDCQPIRPIDEGMHSAFHERQERMFTQVAPWHMFWLEHGGAPPPPAIDFTVENVIAIVLGDRPTTGYWIRVDCVRFLEEPGAPRHVQVEYTEMVPGQDCTVEDLITQPYFFFATPIFMESTVEFVRHEEVYSCGQPPDCLPQETIAEGDTSGIMQFHQLIIRDDRTWQYFWSLHAPGSTPPPIDFTKTMVVTIVLGPRQTNGYYATIDCVRLTEDPMGNLITVEWTEYMPGQTCEVLPILTSPFIFAAVPRYDGMDNFTGMAAVYECR